MTGLAAVNSANLSSPAVWAAPYSLDSAVSSSYNTASYNTPPPTQTLEAAAQGAPWEDTTRRPGTPDLCTWHSQAHRRTVSHLQLTATSTGWDKTAPWGSSTAVEEGRNFIQKDENGGRGGL